MLDIEKAGALQSAERYCVAGAQRAGVEGHVEVDCFRPGGIECDAARDLRKMRCLAGKAEEGDARADLAAGTIEREALHFARRRRQGNEPGGEHCSGTGNPQERHARDLPACKSGFEKVRSAA